MIKHSRRIFVSLYECSGLALLEVYKYKEYFLIKLKTCLLILQRKYGVY